MINYHIIEKGNKKKFEGFFSFQGRVIWYYTYVVNIENGLIINLYLDEELKLEESKDYISRTKTLSEKYTMEGFYKKQHSFGTIAMLHNTKENAEQVYVNYKSRNQIEGMIDVLKNILNADTSYMQNEQALETWMFINYISLHWYYKIYQILAKQKLTGKFSPMDLIMFLKQIRKVNINNKWHLAEITNKTKKIIDQLNIPIT